MQGWIKRLWTDSLVYGIGYGVSRFLQVIILPIIAKALSLSEFGFYSNYVIFYTVAGGLFILGLDSAVARYFYDRDDKRYHEELFSTSLLFILIVSLSMVTLFSLFPRGIVTWLGVPEAYSDALKYVLMSIPAISVNGFLLNWFKWKRDRIFFLINSGSTVVLLLIPLLVHHVTFLYVFKVIFYSQLVVAILSTVLASGYFRLYFKPGLLWSLLRYGFPWMLVFIFGISRTYLDRAFLNQYLSPEMYGMYNFSVRVATLIALLTTAFDMSFGPLAFSIWDKPGAAAFFAKLQSFYVLIISAVACAICIVSPVVIRLLGGTKYLGAEGVLPLLLFAAIPISLINFSNLGTSYAKKSFLSTISLFIGFVAVLLLNLLLTRRYLQYGAAAASLLGQFLIVVAGYLFSRRYYKIPFSYLRDATLLVTFFVLSLVAIHFPVKSQIAFYSLIRLIILTAIVFVLLVFLFPVEYRKASAAVKKLVRFRK